METNIQKQIPEHKDKVQLLQCLDFQQFIATKLPAVTVEFSDRDGVVFAGEGPAIEKAATILSDFLSRLRKSAPMSTLDIYKLQLLHSKEAQQFVRDKLIREGIQCHFTFDENKQYIKLYARSSKVISNAERALKQYLCVMKVSSEEPFLISAVQDLSLEYAGRFLQIDEKNQSVIVFTHDIKETVDIRRKKANELDRSSELESKGDEEYIEKVENMNAPYIKILKCLSFDETTKAKHSNVEIGLDEKRGVVLKGSKADVKKVTDLLRTFDETLKTSGPEWGLDYHKIQLLYAKETQHFLQQEILRQRIKCCFTFETDDGSVKLFACSNDDITKAQALVEQCICVMDVPLGDTFIESEAMDLSLDFSGKFLQIDEEDKAVFVFTSDIESVVVATRNKSQKKNTKATVISSENTPKDKKYVHTSDSDNDSREESSEDHVENQFSCNKGQSSSIHTQSENSDLENTLDVRVKEAEGTFGSMAYVCSETIYMCLCLAEFLFSEKLDDIHKLEETYSLSVSNDYGIITISGECESETIVKEVANAIEKMASNVSMKSKYFAGRKSKQYFASDQFEMKKKEMKTKHCNIIVNSVGVHEMVDTVTAVFDNLEIKIVNSSVIDLENIDVIVCPLNSSLAATSEAAEQILDEGGGILQRNCALTFQKFLAGNSVKPPLCYVFNTNEVGRLPCKQFCSIVIEDWYTNRRELMVQLVAKMKDILDYNSRTEYTSIALPLDVGEKVPVLELAKLYSEALRCHRQYYKSLQVVYLCVLDKRSVPNVVEVVNKTLNLQTEPVPMTKNFGQFQRKELSTNPVRVSVVTGSLVEQKVGAIVCTVNERLELKGGAISHSILKEGGQEILNTIKKENEKGIGPSDVIKTGPGDLPCTLIFFGNLPHKGDGYNCEECLKRFINNCFSLAKGHGIKDIAFPAIGTGALEYPCDIVARELFRAVYLYADICGVQNVTFVMYERDTEVIQVFKEYNSAYREEMDRISKELRRPRQKINIRMEKMTATIDIVQEGCASSLADIVIVHGQPKKELTTDTFLDEQDIIIRRKGSLPSRFMREVVFLLIPDASTYTYAEKYRKAMEYSVVRKNVQILNIDVTDCNELDVVTTVCDILEILKVLLGQNNLVEKVHISVHQTQMRKLLEHADKLNSVTVKERSDGHKKKQTEKQGIFGKLANSASSVAGKIGQIFHQTPMSWNVEYEHQNTSYDTDMSVTVFAPNDNMIQDAMNMFDRELKTFATDDIESAVESSDKMSWISDDSSGEYDDALPDNVETRVPAEIYGTLTSEISSSVTSRHPKAKLEDMVKRLNDPNIGISAKLSQGKIKIQMDYSKKVEVERHLNEVIGNPAISTTGPFYIHDVDQRSYDLLKQGLKRRNDEAKAILMQLDITSGDLTVQGNKHTYEDIRKDLNSVRTYTSDSLEIKSSVKSDTVDQAIETIYTKYEDLIINRQDNEIEIHGPSEIIQTTKHELKLILGLVKRTDRGNRSVANKPLPEYSSLCPSLSGSSMMQPEDRRSQHMSLMDTTSLNDSQYAHANELKRQTKLMTLSTTENMKVKVYKGSITDIKVDCIVNAAYERLDHAGGVAWVIARAGGKEFEKESEHYVSKQDELKVTQSLSTGAGKMKFKRIIHAVGPRWDKYKDKEQCKADLSQTVVNCLKEADATCMESIGIPSISAGIFGMPKNICAEQYVRGVCEFSSGGRSNHLKKIHFVDIHDDIVQIIQNVFSNVLVVIPIENYESKAKRDKHDHGENRTDEEDEDKFEEKNTVEFDRNMRTYQKSKESVQYQGSDGQYGFGSGSNKNTAPICNRSGSPELLIRSTHDKSDSVHGIDERPIGEHGEFQLNICKTKPTSPRTGYTDAPKNKKENALKQDSAACIHTDQTSPEMEPTLFQYHEGFNEASAPHSQSVIASSSISELSVHGDQRNPYEFYPFSTEFCILVYLDDISKVNVDAVVSIEDEFCRGNGKIAQAIGTICGPSYAAKHRKLLDKHLKITEAYCTSVEDDHDNSNGKWPPFKYVIHTVAPRWNRYVREKEIKSQLSVTVRTILKITCTHQKIRTIGIPLLGMGDESTDVGACCKALIDGVTDFCADRKSVSKQLQAIHLIGNDVGVVYLLKELTDAYCRSYVTPASPAEIWQTVDKKKKKKKKKGKRGIYV